LIDVLRPETNARSVIEPEPTSHWLFHGTLEPLTAPQTFDPLVVQLPSCISQHGCDPTITVNTHTDGPVRSCPESDVTHCLGTSEHSGASSDSSTRPGRRGVRKHRTAAAPGRYNCVDARGLEVSLRNFTQNEFIQCEIGHSSAKAFVLLLNSLQLIELIRPHATLMLAPTLYVCSLI
jgi:hypothetical protein